MQVDGITWHASVMDKEGFASMHNLVTETLGLSPLTEFPGVDETADDLSQPRLRGEVQRDVVQASDAVGLRVAAPRLPGVEAEVVVVAARREEQHVADRAPAGDVAGLEDDVEAHDPHIEFANAADVGRA